MHMTVPPENIGTVGGWRTDRPGPAGLTGGKLSVGGSISIHSVFFLLGACACAVAICFAADEGLSRLLSSLYVLPITSIVSSAARAWRSFVRQPDPPQSRDVELYQLLREVNRSLAHTQDEQQLLDDICRIAHLRGGYSLVTIGLLDGVEDRLRIVATAGMGSPYLESITVSPHLPSVPHCPIDQALRRDRAFVCDAIGEACKGLPCQREAHRLGHRASAAFPLRMGGEIRGVMALYSSTLSYFDTTEVGLLETLADDISYALEATRRRVRQKESEEALEETERTLGAIVNGSREAIGISCEGRNLFVNEGFIRLFGFAAKEELIGRPVVELIAPEFRETVQEQIRRRARGEEAPPVYVVDAVRRDGTTFPMEIHATGYELNGKAHVIVFLRDVTDSQRVERQLESMSRFPDENPRPVMRVDRDGIILFANRASLPVREIWKTECGSPIPVEWRERSARALKTGVHQVGVVTAGGRTYSLTAVPILLNGYVNLYGEDVTELHRTVTALRNSEELFRTAAQSLSDVVYEWDLRDTLTWHGDIDRLLGYAPGTFPRTLSAWQERIHPDDLAAVERETGRVLAGRGDYFAEFRIRQLSGEYRNWTARGQLLYDSNGLPSRWVGSVTDTTEKVKLGQSLKETERDLRALSTHMLDAFVSTDMQGRIRECNSSFCTLVGYTLDELRHLRYDQLTPVFWREADQEVMRDHLIPRGYSDVYEKEYSTRDGSTVPVELRSVLVRDDSGEAIGIWAIVRDITQRKRAAKALQRSEERYRGLFENMLEGAAFCQMIEGEHRPVDFIVLAVNDAFESMTGLQDATGRRGKDLLPDLQQSDPHMMELFERVVRTGMPERVELYLRAIRMWFAVSVFRPGPGFFVVILDDISARKRAEEEIQRLNASLEERIKDRTRQLEVANKELESFSSSVSHDLRAPLRGIDGWSLALLEDCGPSLDAKGKTYLERIRTDTQRMGRLIDDLLGLARITRQKLNRSTVDLGELARTVICRVREHYAGRMIEFVVQPDLFVEADPSLLEIVLTNLIDNACKFTRGRETARIEIGRVKSDGVINFFVRDNGAGFDMQHANRLFGAFQRLHRQSEFPGTGIGLALVQRIILRHGGAIWAEAEKDQGAKFSFTI